MSESGERRVGQGWDIHRLVPGRPLLLGGVHIPFDRGEDGHSDGDVLLHAIIDALLGATALGDIGTHFPPQDERWRGADSCELVANVRDKVRGSGWTIVNLDCTIIIERPKLKDYIIAIRRRISETLGMEIDRVSVKAKTNEGLGEIGEGRAVEAMAIVMMMRPTASVRNEG